MALVYFVYEDGRVRAVFGLGGNFNVSNFVEGEFTHEAATVLGAEVVGVLLNSLTFLLVHEEVVEGDVQVEVFLVLNISKEFEKLWDVQ